MPWNDNSNNNGGPWGNRPGGRRPGGPKNPWGGGGNNGKPPDMDELLKPFGGGANTFFGWR